MARQVGILSDQVSAISQQLSSIYSALNQDFQLTETFLRFISCSRRQCFDIVIIDDDIIEDVEMFNITLWPPPFGLPRRFTLSPNVTTVTIENDDSTLFHHV